MIFVVLISIGKIKVPLEALFYKNKTKRKSEELAYEIKTVKI